MKQILILLPIGLASMLLARDPWVLPTDQPKLRPGPGVEVVAANCQLCHSADYVSTQPPLARAAWLAMVNKMREKYGAPLQTNQVAGVVDYLEAAYGKKPR